MFAVMRTGSPLTVRGKTSSLAEVGIGTPRSSPPSNAIARDSSSGVSPEKSSRQRSSGITAAGIPSIVSRSRRFKLGASPVRRTTPTGFS